MLRTFQILNLCKLLFRYVGKKKCRDKEMSENYPLRTTNYIYIGRAPQH